MNDQMYQSPFPVWILGFDLEVMSCNAAAEEISKSPFECMSQDDAEVLRKYILNSGASVETPTLRCKFFNQAKWYKWSSKKSTDRFYLGGSDVTELKEKELVLNEILDAIPDMVLVKGKGSKLLWANLSFQKYYGMNNDDLRNLIDAPFNAQGYTKQYIIDDAWVWDNKKKLTIDCEPVTSSLGEERKFQTLKSPILDKEGNTLMTVGISRDITEKLLIQEKSLTQSKMAALGEMAGGIAHEINNPLGVILGKARQLQNHLDKATFSPENAVNHLKSIQDHSIRISRIIEGLQNFCSGTEKDTSQVISINKVIQDTLSFCHARMQSRQINFILDNKKDILIEGRSIQLSQIILNLLNNAIDAIEGMGAPWIKLTITVNENWMELRVQDSGKGVPEEIDTKILQPFFTTKAVGKGMGLGLSISQTFAKEHGGLLKIDRDISASCFLLRLPMKNGDQR